SAASAALKWRIDQRRSARPTVPASTGARPSTEPTSPQKRPRPAPFALLVRGAQDQSVRPGRARAPLAVARPRLAASWPVPSRRGRVPLRKFEDHSTGSAVLESPVVSVRPAEKTPATPD